MAEILWNGEVAASGMQPIIPDAKLWDDLHPNLYTCRIRLVRNGDTLDEMTETFGIRSISVDAENGLLINGKTKKLIGGCLHHTNGILGAFDNKAAALHTVKVLKDAGFNAVRGAHNPRSKEFLEACDELGMYVMDEFFDGWFTSGTYGYPMYFDEMWREDLTLSVRKAFNHPSVIMYSIGNEVSETAKEKGLTIAKAMTELTHELDATRPVIMGVNLMMNTMQHKFGMKLGGDEATKLSRDDVVDPKRTSQGNIMDGSVLFNLMVSFASAKPIIESMSKPKASDPGSKEIFSLLDIAGYNYGDVAYDKHHEMYPQRVMVGTETKAIDVKKRIIKVRKSSYVIGDFVWTAMDYLGECGLGIIDYNKKLGSFTKPYPAIAAGCGMLDLTGRKEAMYYDLAIAWGKRRNPAIAVSHPVHAKDKMYSSMYRTTDGIDSWTFPGFEGSKTNVRVVSPGKEVELYLNGEKIGRRKLKDGLAHFTVTYQPGTLSAVAYDRKGQRIGDCQLVTAESNTVIRLTPDKTKLMRDRDDLLYLDIDLTDINGIYKPVQQQLHVEVEGPAELLALGSGNYRTTESYNWDTCTTYNGHLQAVIRGNGETGPIKITVSGKGLRRESIRIE